MTGHRWGLSLRIQTCNLVPILDASALWLVLATWHPTLDPRVQLSAVLLQAFIHQLAGLHRWSSAQRPSTRVVAGLLCSWVVALCAVWLSRAVNSPEASVWAMWGLVAGIHIVCRATLRRMASLMAAPVRVIGEGAVARTTAIALDNALLPSYRQVGPGGPGEALQLKGGEEVNSPALRLPVLETPGEGLSYTVKRSCDLLAAIPISLVILPALAVLSTMLRIGGQGPVFHSQVRLTLHGRPFRLYKLRTMNRDAEPAGAPVWPQSSDARITPLGHFLRRFWVDEWPQILNVLQGDLSLIGPRPERPVFVKEFIRYLPKYNERHCAPCGITGLSQALGFAGNTSLKKRLFLDRLYIQKWSPWFDLRVLLLTALHFFNRQGRRQFDYTPGTGQAIP